MLVYKSVQRQYNSIDEFYVYLTNVQGKWKEYCFCRFIHRTNTETASHNHGVVLL